MLHNIKQNNNLILKVVCVCSIVLIIMVIYHSTRTSHQYSFQQSEKSKARPKNVKNRKLKSLIDQTNIAFSNFAFEGVSPENKPYIVKAESAEKLDDNKYLLREITAAYNLPDLKMRISSKQGKIDQTKKFTHFTGKSYIDYNNYKIIAKHVILDLDNYHIRSNHPMNMQWDESKLEAKCFEVKGREGMVYLNGGVHATIKMDN